MISLNDCTQKLRVANIVEEGKLGGPQVYIARLAFASKDDVETTVVVPLANSERFCELLGRHDIHYKLFNLTKITKEFGIASRYLLFSWYETLQLARYFRKEKFDLIYVSGGSWQYKGVFAGKLSGTKVVWHLNDTYTPSFIRKFFSLCSGLPDAYIFASERTREYYSPLIPDGKPGFVIPAPVDTSLFDSTQSYQGDDVIKKWAGKFVVGTVANVNPVKGLDIFIKAAAELNKNIADICFVVVGPIFDRQKKYFNELQSLCLDLGVQNIDFVGPRSDVRPFLQRFDAYVCSSRNESSPIAVWEAMAMGKLIVSTDVGDVPLYIHDGENGFVVDVGDYQALAERIGYLLKNKNLWPGFRAGVRDVAVKELDVKQCAARHLEVYSHIMGRK